MNLLAYVHLRNIHCSTGAGRVARLLTENLATQPGMNLRVLADPEDHRRVISQVGRPWNDYQYHFFGKETSRQQAQWFFCGGPRAEQYWPDVQVTFCTAESYVPTKRSRLVVTLHDAAYFEQGAHPRTFAVMKQQWKWKLLYRTLTRKVDMFHTVSHFSAERLGHFFPEIRSRLRVVHNAVAPRFFQPVSAAGEAFLQKKGLANRPFVFLPRGLHHRKNGDLVLKAWPQIHKLYPDARLVATMCEPEYRHRAEALGDSVLLTGFVDDEALCSMYHAARVVWFPSLYEGFGLPVLESMACGTPVVASNNTSIPEVAGQAAILVSSAKPGEHVSAIDSLLRNPSLRNEYARRGSARARQFTWDSSALQLRKYMDVLAGRSIQ